MEERQPRKLAVILHADVVGSTALVQKNESLAHARIQDAFRRFSSTIEAYSGVTHELRGDALVAEFARASDAVAAGLAFQIENTESNARLEDDLQPRLRIGISLGEVVIADSTVTGAGVVLAQRVEQLAEPGGVCITGAIHEAVPQYLPLEYSDLGKREAKGFEEPVQVYSASVEVGKQVPPPESAVSVGAQSRKPKRLWTAGAISLLVLVVGGLAWWQPWVPRVEPASIERMAFSLPDKPSIAVLPFTNMSGDAEQEYFVDGMTEDLITDLSKLTGLFVIARNSTFTYKGKSVKVGRVAEELGVRYVLEGSVRRAGNRVRINAQLIDATTGGHLWAERYDGSPSDVFALQDYVTQKIVAALAVKLTSTEKANQQLVETTVPEAYDSFLKGWAYYQRQTPEDFGRARGYLERALELDANYSRAAAALAAIYWETHIRQWHPGLKLDVVEVKKRAFAYRDQAMLKPTPLALVVASDMLMWRGQHEKAISQTRRAIELAPSDAHAALELAEILVYAGRPEEAMRYVADAARLDPHGEPRQLYVLGIAYFGLDRFEEAAASLVRALELNPDYAQPSALLAAALGYLGREQEAADTLRPYVNEYWAGVVGVGSAVLQFPYQHDKDRERLAKGLRLAGMKEF